VAPCLRLDFGGAEAPRSLGRKCDSPLHVRYRGSEWLLSIRFIVAEGSTSDLTDASRVLVLNVRNREANQATPGHEPPLIDAR